MIGTTIGPYRVLDKLGEGGMGEVYLARDTKLNRDVALKLLPAAVADDPDRLSRFRREAQVLAALNHPNIAQIYGIEDSAPGPPALVMELVPGRTLSEVVREGPLHWREAQPIARQLALALEAAHEAGIVHRDLKPANIKVRDDGTVKVLDFGLAKALDSATVVSRGPGRPGSTGLANSPTMTSPARLGPGSDGASTAIGIILGTAAYMAPEQAKGRPVDKRADIWAFGVVLFELLTGRTLFAGESVTETIAAVIKDEPKLYHLADDTPPALRTLLTRCLARDPTERLRDIGEARILLSGSLEPREIERPAIRAPRWLLAGAAALAAAVLTGAAVWWVTSAAGPPLLLRRLELPLPAGVTQYAISPDATRLAYIAAGQLYVRRFDELDATPLSRVHVTARQLAWSPGGETIAFTADGAIQTIPAAGGPTFVVSRIPASGRAMGQAWLPDGTIVFSVWRDSLYSVPATGGTPGVLLAIDDETEIDFHQVSALPDGRLLVATHRRQEDSDVIELVETTGRRHRTVLTSDRNVSWFEYVEPGALLFRRTRTNVGIWSVPFQEGPIDVNRATLLQADATDYRVAADGTVVALIPATVKASLVWLEPNGTERVVPGAEIESPESELELSPDGGRVAFVHGVRATASASVGSLNAAHLVVRDLATGADTRLNVSRTDESMWADTGSPTWFPDGQRLLHRAGGVEAANLLERRADIAGRGRILTPGFLGRVLPDGRTLVHARDERGVGRIYVAQLGSNGAVESSTPLFPGPDPPNARDFDVSADGLLIAFTTRHPSGRGDVFLARITDPAEQWLVQEGGAWPRFGANGELFYTAGGTSQDGRPEGRLMRVRVTTTPGVSVGPAETVLHETAGGPRLAGYEPSLDGRRFLMWKDVPPRPGEEQRYVLVQNALVSR